MVIGYECSSSELPTSRDASSAAPCSHLTEHTVTTADELIACVDEVRAQGHALVDQELEKRMFLPHLFETAEAISSALSMR